MNCENCKTKIPLKKVKISTEAVDVDGHDAIEVHADCPNCETNIASTIVYVESMIVNELIEN